MAAKHKDTRYRVIYAKDYQIESKSHNVIRDFEIYHQDTLFRCNVDYLTDELMALHKYTFTLIDKQDIDIFHRMLSNNCRRNVNDCSGMAGILRNMATMSKNHQKNLYIRCIPPQVALSPESYRVFAEDVLDVVPLILKRQNTKMSAKHIRILNVKNGEWRKKDDDKSLDLTVSFEQLDEFLEKFDCDKSLLTLVEDPMYTATKMDQETHSGYRMTCAPDLTQVIDPLQAAAFFFHSVVNGVDWSRKEPCLEHGPECLKTLKKRFMRILEEYAKTDVGYYHSWTKVRDDCAMVRKDACFLKYWARRITPDYALQDFAPSFKFQISHFYQTAVYYNLLDETDRFPEHVTYLYVWTIRFLLQLGWVQQFFGNEEHKPIRDLIANSALFLVPVEDRKEIEGMMLRMFQNGNDGKLELKYFEPLGLRQDPEEEKEKGIPEPQESFQPLQLAAPPGFFEKRSILTNKVVRYQKCDNSYVTVEVPVAPRVPPDIMSSLESDLPRLIESLQKSLETAENGEVSDDVRFVQKKVMSLEIMLSIVTQKVEKGIEPTKSELAELKSILKEIPELHKKLQAKESENTKPRQEIAMAQNALPETQKAENGSTMVPEDLLLLDKEVSSLEFAMSFVMEKIEKGEEITPEDGESLSILADLPGLHQRPSGLGKNFVSEESIASGMESLDTKGIATVRMAETGSTTSEASGLLSILPPPPGLHRKLSLAPPPGLESAGITFELPGLNQKSEMSGVVEIAVEKSDEPEKAGNDSTSFEMKLLSKESEPISPPDETLSQGKKSQQELAMAIMPQNLSTDIQKAEIGATASEISVSLSILPSPPGLHQRPPGLNKNVVPETEKYAPTAGNTFELPGLKPKLKMAGVAEFPVEMSDEPGKAANSHMSSAVPTPPVILDEPKKAENDFTTPKTSPGLPKKLPSGQSTLEKRTATPSILAKPPGLHKKLWSEMFEPPTDLPCLDKKNGSNELEKDENGPVILGPLNTKMVEMEIAEEIETTSFEISPPPLSQAALSPIPEQPALEEFSSSKPLHSRKTKNPPVKIPQSMSNGKIINLCTPQSKPKKTKVIILEEKNKMFEKEFASTKAPIPPKPLFLIRNLGTVSKKTKKEESQMVPTLGKRLKAILRRKGCVEQPGALEKEQQQPAPPKITVAQVKNLWDYIWEISNLCDVENRKIVKIVADYNEAKFPVLEESQLEQKEAELAKDLSNLKMEQENNHAKKSLLLARQEKLLRLNAALQMSEGDMKEKIQKIIDEHESLVKLNDLEARKLMEEKDVAISQLKQTHKALSAQNTELDATIRELTTKIREIRR